MYEIGELDATAVRQWRLCLQSAARSGLSELSEPQLIDLLRELEELKCTAAGAQATAAATFDRSQRASREAEGVPAARRGRGVAEQIALARKESPAHGRTHLGLAVVLGTEMPNTLAALIEGRITEWKATIVVQQTACLSAEHRAVVDDTIAGSPEALVELEQWGPRRLTAELLRLAQQLDVEALVKRRRKAESERRVTGRPAPDTMMYLTALLTAKDGVGVLAALTAAANSAIAQGDARTRDQLMADTLVARVTGRDPVCSPTPVVIDLVVTDASLFDCTEHGCGHESAFLQGYGPVPAELARELATAALANDVADGLAVALRLLRAEGGSGRLVGMESKARLFPPKLAELIRLRDQTCRTPWCEAPIRHVDHVVPHAEGGATSETNGQGLCTACNHAKQAPGWRSRPSPGGRHTVTTTTPTGHRYTSTAPPLAG